MKGKAYLCVLLAGCFWGLNGLFYRNLFSMAFPAMTIIFVKTIIASGFLGVYLLLTNLRFLHIHIKDLWIFAGAGALGIMMLNFCYFSTLNYTTVAIGVALTYTAPAFVMILSFFLFKETITLKKGAALCLILMGCIFISGVLTGALYLKITGLVFGCCAGLCNALYSIFSRFSLNHKYSPLTYVFYATIFASIAALPFAEFKFIDEIIFTSAVFSAVGLGLFCGLIPYLLFVFGLKHIETGEAAMLATSELIASTLLSIFILDEKVTLLIISGILLIIGGIVTIHGHKKNDLCPKKYL